MSTRFSQYRVLLVREPASFWRENVVAFVTQLRVLVRMSTETSYKVLEVLSFRGREAPSVKITVLIFW